MPILPAKAVINVRPFLVRRLLIDRCRAVKKLIDVFFFLPLFVSDVLFLFLFLSFSKLYGLLSSIMLPSKSLIIRVEYCFASSGLCVTIITKRSLDISFNISIICTLVSVSKAPVGSSAKIISGSFIIARAMATRCICPPDSWFGRL